MWVKWGNDDIWENGMVILLLMTTNNDERFEIAPEEDAVVGTEILDPNLPSNLDFDQREPAII